MVSAAEQYSVEAVKLIPEMRLLRRRIVNFVMKEMVLRI
jgi:hypothetical protein